jgi:hypothetical protein
MNPAFSAGATPSGRIDANSYPIDFSLFFASPPIWMPDQQHELLSACFRRSSLTDGAKPARFASPETAQQRRAVR